MINELQLEKDVIEKVEKDLRCYPDWIIRIDVGGLGIPSHYANIGGAPTPIDRSSFVEDELELTEEIKQKVTVIEKVYDRLRGKPKQIIDFKYFQNYSREEILTTMRISKKGYYRYRDMAFESFARALGYIL